MIDTINKIALIMQGPALFVVFISTVTYALMRLWATDRPKSSTWRKYFLSLRVEGKLTGRIFFLLEKIIAISIVIYLVPLCIEFYLRMSGNR